MAAASGHEGRWRAVAMRVPHALSVLRIALVGVTYWAVLAEDRALFAVLVLLAVLTDILDGPIARAAGTASRFGANLDSASDFAFYLSLPVWVWMLRPDVIVENFPVIVLFTLLYVGANTLSHLTFGALGVHNRLSRTSGTLGVAFAFYVVLWGIHPVGYVALVATMSADLAQRYGAVIRAHRDRIPWFGPR